MGQMTIMTVEPLPHRILFSVRLTAIEGKQITAIKCSRDGHDLATKEGHVSH